jgi:hypothetical protein
MEILKIDPLDSAFDKCYVYYLMVIEPDEKGLIIVDGVKVVSIFNPENRTCYLSSKAKARELYHNSFLITLDYIRTSIQCFPSRKLFEKERTMEQTIAEEIFASMTDNVCSNLYKALNREKVKEGIS